MSDASNTTESKCDSADELNQVNLELAFYHKVHKQLTSTWYLPKELKIGHFQGLAQACVILAFLCMREHRDAQVADENVEVNETRDKEGKNKSDQIISNMQQKILFYENIHEAIDDISGREQYHVGKILGLNSACEIYSQLSPLCPSVDRHDPEDDKGC